MRPFGTERHFARGTRIATVGEPSEGMYVILSGAVQVTQRDGMGHVVPIVRHGPGQFLAEVGMLSGRPSLVDGHADEDVEVLVLPPARLRGLIIAEADLGERIVRALILRRVALIEAGATGPVLIGRPNSACLQRLQTFLRVNGHPHHVLDPDHDDAAAALARQYDTAPGEALVVCPNGSTLINPSELSLARCLGMTDAEAHDELFDVAVVGAGPAGLATAVYAASEGLRVVVFDCRAYGGQAGASARIENYFGFPTGITGQALVGRAFVQAQKFGAEMLIPAQVDSLVCAMSAQGGEAQVRLKDGRTIRSRTLVVATGAHYRRPDIANLADFESNGVWYWASAIEAKLCAGSSVVLVGGGNSAGQAAVFLSRHAAKVYMLIRGPGLAASMSRYLIDRIDGTPNIELIANTQLTELHGSAQDGLTAVTWQNRQTGETQRHALRHVFLFVGADPETEWLRDCGVELDAQGFVLTGAAARGTNGKTPDTSAADARAADPVASLQSSVHGVFAIGDVRSGSVKRVGGAIGEGANVVAQIHHYLAVAST
jgi:thioredoxin reductase (NADPH)